MFIEANDYLRIESCINKPLLTENGGRENKEKKKIQEKTNEEIIIQTYSGCSYIYI